jgi:nitrite reductase/ring-hydroxylating ferredoxin subunit
VTTVRATTLDAVGAGCPLAVDVGGRPVVLTRVGDRVYACGGVCPHRGGPLGEGRLSGTRLACPHHGWTFDVRTGQCLFPGRGAAVPTYPVTIEGESVFVDVPDGAATPEGP